MDESVAATDDVGQPDEWTGPLDLRGRAALSGYPSERDQAAVLRDRAAELRDEAGDLRDHTAVLRDEEADLRRGPLDAGPAQRDRDADRRDRDADRRDREADHAEAANRDTGVPFDNQRAVTRELAAADRRQASRDRTSAAEDRKAAARDRLAASLDREMSAADRALSSVDRRASSEDRTVSAVSLTEASLDALTGAYVRGPGLRELERDLSRTNRAGETFTVAFVDVDGLKEVNDREGHAAGDRLLTEVVTTLWATMRSYDVVVRYGGDEFVCGMSGVTMPDMALKLARVNDTLATRFEGCGSVTVGLAEFEPGDSVESLVARADAALYNERRRHAALG